MKHVVRIATLAAAAAALALGAAPAGAIKLENYQKYRLDSRNVQATFKSLIEVRIEGVLQGLFIANRAAVAAGARPLFCPPANLQMRGADAVKLLDTELTSGTGADGKPYPGDTNIEDVMLKVAQKQWPCAR
ncbi:MAG: hypothetical protein JNM29_21380 [Candidatus Odyssella sp.]|nr:hypothetical protein [Candidatus Odyssella sp.]